GDSLGKAMVQLLTQPTEPRVLLLGDSISIGYTPFVKHTLGEDAFVVRPMNHHRAARNCQGTRFGVSQIDRWLSIGGGRWDVIHFNFGLHDLKHVDPETGRNSGDPEHPEQSPPEQYEHQLREIVAKLKATGAELIFATTTPVPEGGVRPFRDPHAPRRYNEIARRIMDEHDIAINDLYTFADARLSDIQKPVDVHFTPEGSQAMAQEVVRHIRSALASRQ
ncbi:MAG: SGNH/GDSL hydrolase family protein, partial [Pirellulaceae bacterium]